MYVLIDQYYHYHNSVGTNVIGVFTTKEKVIEGLNHYANRVGIKLVEISSNHWDTWKSNDNGNHWIISMDLEVDNLYEWDVEGCKYEEKRNEETDKRA